MKAAAEVVFPIIEGGGVSSSESPAHLKQSAARYSFSKSFKGLAQPVFYTVAFFVVLVSFSGHGNAEEIVFRFTEDQAGEACKAWHKGNETDPFSVIRSEDDNYALVCLEQGRWTLLKKGVHDGDKQQWDPVERAYLDSTEAQ